jgi:hypothetical protein
LGLSPVSYSCLDLSFYYNKSDSHDVGEKLLRVKKPITYRPTKKNYVRLTWFFKIIFVVEDGVNQLIEDVMNENKRQKQVEIWIDNLEEER